MLKTGIRLLVSGIPPRVLTTTESLSLLLSCMLCLGIPVDEIAKKLLEYRRNENVIF